MKAKYWGGILLVSLWLPVGLAGAFGLGDLKIRSPLGVPLVAEINLLAIHPNQIDGLSVGLATDVDFSRAGIERGNVLDEITFTPMIRDDGSAMIEVASQNPISEPYLHFLLTLKWARGQIVREYVLLLDQPDHDGTIPPKIIGPEIPTAEIIAQFSGDQVSRGVQAVGATAGRPYGPVQRLEYLIGIGNRLDLPKDISIYQRLYAILMDNRHAFIQGNMNLLRAGVVLDIPTEAQMASVSRVLAMETFIRQVAEWQEYRLKVGTSSEGATEFDRESAELTVMKATMAELEAEIVNLRQRLEGASLQESQSLAESTDTAQIREQLIDDIRRLEVARDQLIETIERLSDLPDLEAQMERITRVDTSTQTLAVTAADPGGAIEETPATIKASSNSEKNELFQEKNLETETTRLSRDLASQKLQEQVLALEKQIQKAVSLLAIKDEALALAQQEAAVYSAALEALEVTSNEQQDGLKQEDSNINPSKVETPAITLDVVDDTEPVLIQEGETVNSVIDVLSDESNRQILFIVGAVLFLLVLFLTIRRKRFEGGRSETQQMARAIVADPLATEFTDDSNVASKLDLARAYVDMEDYEAARELLAEVNAQGDTYQKAEAKRLRDMLGS